MLVLTRRVGEEIVINENIRIKILVTKRDRIRVGITAPRSVRVDREEVHARRSEFAIPCDVAIDRVARLEGRTHPGRQKLIAIASALSEHRPAVAGVTP